MGSIMKYDFRAYRAPAILGLCIMLGCGLASGCILRVVESFQVEELRYSMISASLYMIAGFCQIVISIAFAFICLSAVYRYHQSMFTDEGYLTLVLPLPVRKIYNAKLLSGLILAIIANFVMSVSNTLSSVIANGDFSYFLDLFGFSHRYQELYGLASLDVFSFLLGIIGFLSWTFALGIILYFAVTLAAVWLRKARVLISGCIALACIFVLAFLTAIVANIAYSFGPWDDPVGYVVRSFFADGITYVLILAVSVILYFLTRYLLEHRLNLE